VTEAAKLGTPSALVREGRVQISAAGGVALLRLNRTEKMNAFDFEQIDAFHEALLWFHAAADVRVGVLAGGEHFCTGGDITTFPEIDVERGYAYTRRGYDLLRTIETGEKPLLAAVNGYCLAGGLETALACDFIIAGSNAVFGFGELELGLVPAWGGTVRLARAISPRLARQLTLTSERIDAARAERIGLVNEVVEPERTLERALEIATTIAGRSPSAVRVAKLATQLAADGGGLEGALAAERVGGALLFGTDRAQQAVREWSRPGKVDG
jgi:enoyl-CoA hydratase/carnithine racemase